MRECISIHVGQAGVQIGKSSSTILALCVYCSATVVDYYFR